MKKEVGFTHNEQPSPNSLYSSGLMINFLKTVISMLGQFMARRTGVFRSLVVLMVEYHLLMTICHRIGDLRMKMGLDVGKRPFFSVFLPMI